MRFNTSYLVKILILFSLYFITGTLGLKLDAVNGFASLVWFPTGISLAWLYLFGNKLWPAVLIGAFFVNYLSGAAFYTALGIAIGNTLEAAVGAFLLKRYIHFKSTFDNLREIIGFIIIVTPISAVISATVGVTTLLLSDAIQVFNFVNTWIAWWTGDLISAWIIAPLFIVWLSRGLYFTKRQLAIRALFIGFFLVIGVVIFGGMFGNGIQAFPITYLVFPPLIFASIQFGPRGAITSLFIYSIMAIIGTYFGYGPFIGHSLSENLILLQSFLGALAVTSLIFSAAIAEKERLDKRKNEFIGLAGHELRTPITVIKAYAQVLIKRFNKKTSPNNMELLNNLNTQVDRMAGLIDEFLDIGRLESSKFFISKKKFNFDELVTKIIRDFKLLQGRRVIQKEGSLKIKIKGDQDRIRQVLSNLISNAIKYSPANKKILVKLGRKDGMVNVSVQDFGKGIPREKQKYIFDQFYRILGEKEEIKEGFGLGLYISSQIIQKHGGKIWVTSTVGKGSTFTFTLPIQ